MGNSLKKVTGGKSAKDAAAGLAKQVGLDPKGRWVKWWPQQRRIKKKRGGTKALFIFKN